jgi:hypothetical protein
MVLRERSRRTRSNLWLRIEVMLAELDAGQPSTDVVGDLLAINRLAAQLAAIANGLSCLAPESALNSRFHSERSRARSTGLQSAAVP